MDDKRLVQASLNLKLFIDAVQLEIAERMSIGQSRRLAVACIISDLTGVSGLSVYEIETILHIAANVN